jgi:hypothetical protein
MPPAPGMVPMPGYFIVVLICSDIFLSNVYRVILGHNCQHRFIPEFLKRFCALVALAEIVQRLGGFQMFD